MDCELASETNLTNVKNTIILQTQLLYYTTSDIPGVLHNNLYHLPV